MTILDLHSLTDRLWPVTDLATFIGTTAFQQQFIQLRQVACFRDRYPVISTEITRFAFYPSLLMAFRRCAKFRINFQCGRNAMNRSVSSRRYPRRTFFTALLRLS